ncbi:MAG: hypothetical protein ABI861_05035 [Panacibacter sp.]
MNQYDTFIRDYLYEHRSVSFEKIGTITLDNRPASPEQPPSPASIHFQFNKRAVTTPDLVAFIAAKTGKNKVLINSDLESFVELMRQFINIGNPHQIEGVGIIKLGKSGDYEFAALDNTNKKDDAKASRKQKESYDSPLITKKSSNKSILMFFALMIVLGVLGVIGWGSYKLFVENKNNTPAINTDTIAHTTLPVESLPDTTITKTDSLLKPDSTINIARGDSADYKYIYETTTSAARAYERVNTLKAWGHPSMVDSVKRDSSTIYTLYFKYRLSNADTARMRDSIQKLLSRKIRIRPAG